MQVLTDAHIPYSRLHDVGGAFGSNRYVDIPNIFRNFDADGNDPASYDFAFTDELISPGLRPSRTWVCTSPACTLVASTS